MPSSLAQLRQHVQERYDSVSESFSTELHELGSELRVIRADFQTTHHNNAFKVDSEVPFVCC